MEILHSTLFSVLLLTLLKKIASKNLEMQNSDLHQKNKNLWHRFHAVSEVYAEEENFECDLSF